MRRPRVSRTSGIKLQLTVHDPVTLARVLRAHWRIHPNVGVLVANPIPEADALEPAFVNDVMARALAAARAGNVHGKALTPFLLQKLDELTEGKSVLANVALAEENARLGGELAVALQAISEEERE